ncbi:MAG: ATP-binding cassette domain-containing protein [Acidocella sp.]|nr:ATP-binding cassette domain-containing protein [Acidocella sp.]
MKLCLRSVTVQLAGMSILGPIDFDIAQPGLIALMGPSGIGKSTLLRVIAGLIPPSAGQRQCKGKVATVFQDARLLPWQSALDNAAFGLRADGMARQDARQVAAAHLARLGLCGDDLGKHPRALSGGMRQRVAVARALAVEPALLLLDEPFTGLDTTLRASLHEMLREIVAGQNLAAILVTHDPVEAVTLADRIVVLGGRPADIVADIPCPIRPNNVVEAYHVAAALMQRPEIARVFAAPLAYAGP